MALVTKTYSSKSNTIFANSCANTGLNPILELNYGNMLSRGMIYFDHEKVKKLVEDKTYPDINKLKHILKLTNTGSLTRQMIHKPCRTDFYDEFKTRATSFDLIFFLINKSWDSGIGFDYIRDMHKGEHIAYSQEGSNWFQYRNYFKWDEEGIYSNGRLSKEFDKFTSMKGNLSDIIIGCEHFEYGNEDIKLDVTNVFNKFITGEIDNYGFGIAFTPLLEITETEKTNYVGFYTQHTHSFYEPYIETTYNETIEDDRVNFFLDKPNKLYFYASVGGKNVNLDNIPTCIINGQEMAVKQATKGVYYADVTLSSDEYETDTMMYDIWSNLTYNGKQLKDVELQFVTKAPDGYFSFGLPSSNEETEIVPSIYGINDHEQIKQGDIRKVNVECRIPYTSNQLRSVDGIEYRIYVNSGERQKDVIEWTKVERGYNENFFLINTNDFIPYRYCIEIRIYRNLELINYPKIIEFDIINDITDEIA